jgi:UDP-N-acetylglucosamine 2-epimerase (non-hydrolysing)
MLLFFLGTKAQLIKTAPLIKECERQNVPYKFIFLSQHWNTIDELLKDFEIPPPDIYILKGHDVTRAWVMPLWGLKVLWGIYRQRKRIFSTPHEIVVVHGDTISTLIGAFVGKCARRKVAHVESGLRSFNLLHPFPEEIIRICTFYLSDYYLCPGQIPLQNLSRFGGEKINTHVNTLYDSLTIALEKASNLPKIENIYAICSLHRFENIYSKQKLTEVINLVKMVANTIPLFFVLHLPTVNKLKKFGLLHELESHPNISLLPRQGFVRFIQFINNAEFVITDGGSNQEECFYLGKPCLLLRQCTEREEGLSGNVLLSKFERKNVEDFVHNYHKFLRPRFQATTSPSQLAVKYLADVIRKIESARS